MLFETSHKSEKKFCNVFGLYPWGWGVKEVEGGEEGGFITVERSHTLPLHSG